MPCVLVSGLLVQPETGHRHVPRGSDEYITSTYKYDSTEVEMRGGKAVRAKPHARSAQGLAWSSCACGRC